LFTGGPILTMSEEMNAEAVVVIGERIRHVGSLQQCRKVAGDSYRLVDLQGRCMVPGFIDPHVHVMMLGMCHTWADISYPKVKSIDELVQVLSDFSKHPIPPGSHRC